ncbi:MAG TPA: hypothetical protein VM582_07410 [Candidatus Thermoplasmatota archaeon]|nr:hypothetical protein [Candidatus Thermoplasmatota archaeon]
MEKERGRIRTSPQDIGHVPMSEPDFPNITAMRDFDRQQHIQRAIEAGLSREEAERHAEEHMRNWSPQHIEERER